MKTIFSSVWCPIPNMSNNYMNESLTMVPTCVFNFLKSCFSKYNYIYN